VGYWLVTELKFVTNQTNYSTGIKSTWGFATAEERENHELLVYGWLFPRIGESSEPVICISELLYEESASPSEIFSLQTVPSTAITGNSLLTHAEMERALDELVSIFLDNPELGRLCRAAMANKRIGPDRFAQNFKGSLKAFSLDLKEEIRESINLELTNLISSKASFLASRICRVLEV